MLFLSLSLLLTVAFGMFDHRGRGDRGQPRECILSKEDLRAIQAIGSGLHFHFMEAATTGETDAAEAFIREHFIEEFVSDHPFNDDLYDGLDAFFDDSQGFFAQLLQFGPVDALILNTGANVVFECSYQSDVKTVSTIVPIHIILEQTNIRRAELDELMEVTFVQTEFGCWKGASRRELQTVRQIEDIASGPAQL